MIHLLIDWLIYYLIDYLQVYNWLIISRLLIDSFMNWFIHLWIDVIYLLIDWLSPGFWSIELLIDWLSSGFWLIYLLIDWLSAGFWFIEFLTDWSSPGFWEFFILRVKTWIIQRYSAVRCIIHESLKAMYSYFKVTLNQKTL